MWRAGMLAYTKEAKEKVGIFTVVKSMVEGVPEQGREVEAGLGLPPPQPARQEATVDGLGIPERARLTGPLAGGAEGPGADEIPGGDIPGWFYRLRWPKELAEHCALEPLSPSGLRECAMGRGAQARHRRRRRGGDRA
eukprot:8317116-Pyramimonas_sp.AAC.1